MVACEVRINGKTIEACDCIADAMVVARRYGIKFHAADIGRLYRTVPAAPQASVLYRLQDLRILEIVNVSKRRA